MKTIYKMLLMGIISTSLLSSCNDFLTITPESSYSVDGSYKTQADFVQASVGLYDKIQGLYSSNTGLLYCMNQRTDETNVITPDSPGGYIGGMERFTNDALNYQSAGWLQTYYSMITTANLILEKIDAGTFTDETQRDYIKGECYFFRGFAYWYLGHLFGGMPLYDKSYSVEETKTIARSTQDETFDFAQKDFLSAMEKLPASWTGSNRGRATKYVAEGLLARMDLFRHKYAEAKPYLEDIINSNQFSMASSYVDCVNEAGEYGSERMFEAQFIGGQLGEGQQYSTGNLPGNYAGTLQPFAGFSSYPTVSDSMVASYEPGDLRKDISVTTISNGYNVIVKYHHYASKPVAQNDWGINLPIIRYTDVKMMYAEVLNELNGVNDTSISILNEVRKRAGLNALTSFSSKDDFLKAIIQERKVEFAFEGLRWEDMIRWGIAKSVMNQFLSDVKQDGGTYSMKDTQVLFPIPQSLINSYANDKMMWQNPE